MSDTANTANLASAPLAESGDFDQRLKRLDENRWLATRYAGEAGRPLLVAIYLLYHELARALQAKEAMLGKIRIQWWRETVEQISTALEDPAKPVRRHDLSEELSRLLKERRDLIAPINELIDAFDDIIDDHLRAGHEQTAEHEAKHLAAEAGLTRLAGRALDPNLAGIKLDALSYCGEAHLATVAQLPDFADRWVMARVAAEELPPHVWPAIVHLVADAPGGRSRSPFSRRYRIFKAMLIHRLGKRVEME
ncbi:MAG TPA: squalene/phytoene synthase family protein [Hyphomonadaceae bacterium]|jgi:phytoene synthase|nr:squalene/phytoene synthase family protein [Hyphomonadaceae bacterium]